ncbi:MAG: MAPEG family protein [Pseudomonadota bacterium]|nr:MAPEG family protein [Pseudomonadota bacterium]
MTIAYWCVLVAILLPYVWFGPLSSRLGARRDNEEPRLALVGLQGFESRALGAHQNAFEVTTGFAAAVIIAHNVHAAQFWIDTLAVGFILARIAHGALYLAGFGTLRSLSFGVGLACTIGLFVISA